MISLQTQTVIHHHFVTTANIALVLDSKIAFYYQVTI